MKKNEIAVKVGSQIKAIRRSRHLSQLDLAAQLGIDRSTLTRYESGCRMPNIITLWDIADCLDVSLDELTGRTSPVRCQEDEPIL